MKLRYSIAAVCIAMCASATVSAKTLDNAVALDVKAEYVGNLNAGTIQMNNLLEQKSSEISIQLPDGASAPSKAPAQRVSSSDVEKWNSLGNITFTEGFVDAFFGCGTTTTECEIQEAAEYPGYFRLVNPFLAVKGELGGSYTGTASSPRYMYINATDPNQVFIEYFQTGYTPSSTYGQLSVYSYAGYYLDKGYDAETIAGAGLFGSYSDSVIKFPTETLLCGLANYNNGTLYVVGNESFRVAFPDAKDYSIAVTADGCAADNVISWSVESGADVALVKYMLAVGEYGITAGNLEYTAQNGHALPQTSGNFTFNLANADPGRYTLFVASIDADGNFCEGDGTFFYVQDYDDEEWEKVADVMYGDVFIGSQYKLGYTEFEVELQENVNTPGFYRILNPYSGNFTGKGNNDHPDDHNHYIYVDASDPDAVVLMEGPIGSDWGYGAMVVSSKAYRNGTDFGTLASYDDYNKRITFPVGSLLFAEQNYNHGQWYACTTATGDDFYLEIPKATLAMAEVVEGVEALVELPEMIEPDSEFGLASESTIGTQITYSIENMMLEDPVDPAVAMSLATADEDEDDDEALPVAMLYKDEETGKMYLKMLNPGQFDLVANVAGNEDYAPSTHTQHIVYKQVETGILNVGVDNNTPAEYYNLQGIRVNNTTPGIHIVRHGDKTSKVIVK